MAQDEETPVVAEEPRARLPKMTLVVISLSVLLGIMLMGVIIGGVLYMQKTRSLQAEVAAFKKDMKERERIHGELQAQIEALSRQVDVLKEYAVARSRPEAQEALVSKGEQPSVKASGETKEISEKPVVSSQEASAPRESAKGAKTAVVGKQADSERDGASSPTIPPKIKRPGAEGFSCDLTGKSQEEQALILKRCVGVMDTPPKPRPASK